MDKKGFFFTVAIILLLLSITTAVSLWSRVQTEKEDRIADKFEFDTIGQIMDALSNDQIETYSMMSSYYALHKLNNYTSYNFCLLKTGLVVPALDNEHTGKVNTSIYSLMVNGTVPASEFQSQGGATCGDLVYSPDEKEFIFSNWALKINDMCQQLGWYCNVSDPYDFNAVQSGPWNVSISFKVDRRVHKPGEMYETNGTIPINYTISVIGMTDSMVSQIMVEPNSAKQIFVHEDYDNRSELAPGWVLDDSNLTKGKGFFYGEFTDDLNSSFAFKQILVTDWDSELEDSDYRESWGGIIVTGVSSSGASSATPGSVTVPDDNYTINIASCCNPGVPPLRLTNYGCTIDYNIYASAGTECFDCGSSTSITGYSLDVYPVPAGYSCNMSCIGGLVISDVCDDSYVPSGASTLNPTYNVSYLFTDVSANELIGSLSMFDDTHNTNMGQDTQRYGLIDTDSWTTPSGLNIYLWNLDKIRDMATCGFYIPSEYGPSFFQRMVHKGYDLKSSSYGIESFVQGKWAGGYGDTSKDECSRIDYSFVGCIAGHSADKSDSSIKGMPGCKSQEMCSGDDAVNEGIGHFGLSYLDNHGSDQITDYGLGWIACENDAGHPIGAECD